MSEPENRLKMYPPPAPIARVVSNLAREDGLPQCGRSACPRYNDDTCAEDDGASPSLVAYLCLPEIRARIGPPPVGGEIHRVQMRCSRCQAWQSVHPDDARIGRPAPRSGCCGAELVQVDLVAYAATVPKAKREVDEVKLKAPPGSSLVKTE